MSKNHHIIFYFCHIIYAFKLMEYFEYYLQHPTF